MSKKPGRDRVFQTGRKTPSLPPKGGDQKVEVGRMSTLKVAVNEIADDLFAS